MKKSSRLIPTVLLLLCILVFINACSDPNQTVEEYAMIVTEEDIDQLYMFPNLKYADLRGSTCYEAIREYMESNPQVTVRYNVVLGKEKADSTASEIQVDCSGIPFDEMNANLAYLPNLKKIMLSDMNYSMDELQVLQQNYPSINFDYSVRIFDNEYSSDSTQVNLSKITPESITDTLSKLEKLPNVTYAELMSPIGTSSLSMTDVKKMHNALPNITFHYSFELFGKLISTTDEVVEYIDYKLGNDAEAELRSALDILQGCSILKLDDCGIDTSVLGKLRQDYPNTKIVWRLHFGRYSVLTNEKTIRMPSGVSNKNADDLKYCTDVENLDLSFNSGLSNFDFIRYMPNLKIVVLNNTGLKDLSVFENCPNIEWLEIIFCSKITDLTPLKSHTNLKYLNVSYTGVKKLDGLSSLPLVQFMCIKNQTTASEEEKFISEHPDCTYRFTGTYPQGVGWRLKSGGKEYIDYYAEMVNIFHYDDPKYSGNKKAG